MFLPIKSTRFLNLPRIYLSKGLGFTTLGKLGAWFLRGSFSEVELTLSYYAWIMWAWTLRVSIFHFLIIALNEINE